MYWSVTPVPKYLQREYSCSIGKTEHNLECAVLNFVSSGKSCTSNNTTICAENMGLSNYKCCTCYDAILFIVSHLFAVNPQKGILTQRTSWTFMLFYWITQINTRMKHEL
jgi:hypothetical protein